MPRSNPTRNIKPRISLDPNRPWTYLPEDRKNSLSSKWTARFSSPPQANLPAPTPLRPPFLRRQFLPRFVFVGQNRNLFLDLMLDHFLIQKAAVNLQSISGIRFASRGELESVLNQSFFKFPDGFVKRER